MKLWYFISFFCFNLRYHYTMEKVEERFNDWKGKEVGWKDEYQACYSALGKRRRKRVATGMMMGEAR